MTQQRREEFNALYLVWSGLICPILLFPEWLPIFGIAASAAINGLIYLAGYWVWRGWRRFGL